MGVVINRSLFIYIYISSKLNYFWEFHINYGLQSCVILASSYVKQKLFVVFNLRLQLC